MFTKSKQTVLDIIKLANEDIGTPSYYYNAVNLRNIYHQIDSSLQHSPRRIFYAAVANGNPAIIRCFSQQGASIHANTVGDAWIAIYAGVARQDIVLTGSNFTTEDLDFIIQNGLYVNFDSLTQLESYISRNPDVSPGVRVHLSCMGKSRIGLSVDEIPIAVQLCDRTGLPLAGLHFYGGTGTMGVQRYIEPFSELFELAKQVPHLRYIDVGGGFGFDYRSTSDQGLDWKEFGLVLDQHMKALSEYHNRPIELWLEPGRCLIAGAGLLLTRVVDVKTRDGIRYLGTDTSIANIAVLSVHGGHRRVTALTGHDRGPPMTCHLCGSSTFSGDYLAKNVQLPPLEIGDLVAIHDCGAYGYAMSSNFLARPRPAEVLYDGSDVKLIRRRETYSDLIRNAVEVDLKSDFAIPT